MGALSRSRLPLKPHTCCTFGRGAPGPFGAILGALLGGSPPALLAQFQGLPRPGPPGPFPIYFMGQRGGAPGASGEAKESKALQATLGEDIGGLGNTLIIRDLALRPVGAFEAGGLSLIEKIALSAPAPGVEAGDEGSP